MESKRPDVSHVQLWFTLAVFLAAAWAVDRGFGWVVDALSLDHSTRGLYRNLARGGWGPFVLDLALSGLAKALLMFALAGAALRWLGVAPRGALCSRPREGTLAPWSLGILALGIYHWSIWRFGAAPTQRLGFFDTDKSTFLLGYLLRFAPSAFLEELTFRGVIFAGLAKKYSAWVAFPVALAIFGMAHLYGGIGLAVQSLLVGTLLTAAYAKTGSLWPGVVLHAASNLLHAVFQYGP